MPLGTIRMCGSYWHRFWPSTVLAGAVGKPLGAVASQTTAFWTALLFLLHPVHVESVAWISERKNVLSLFFLLLAFRSHLLQRSRWLPLGLYLLACLAKTSVVIFPLLLVLTDRCFTDKPFRRSVIDKLPYFLISLVVVIVALTSHAQGGTLR